MANTKQPSQHRNVIRAGGLLALSALLGTGLLALVQWHSHSFIVENERLMLLRSLSAVVPPAMYNNDILQDHIEVLDIDYLGSKKATLVYRARKDNKPVAAVLTVVAPNGYSGPIKLLVGIDYAGTVTGVRVVKHRETPGLGDAIEVQRNPWILGFNGKTLTNPAKSGWKVKRDGGEFDQFTGATITPRAVVAAVHRALDYFKQNREHLFYTTPEELAEGQQTKLVSE